MKVKVRLFAMLRQQAGWSERELELPDGATIEEAWEALVDLVPSIAASRDSVRFAHNRGYAAFEQSLVDGDELALIPPVAGGAHELLLCELTGQALDEALIAKLRVTVPTNADGALVIFVGQTRETPGTPAPGEEEAAARHSGQAVIGLDYEAYAEMALDTFRLIGAEISERFAVRRLAIIHRIGRVELAEASVVIAAAAPHRGAAFDAARYAIEELKARAPIWKSERFGGGSVWIGAPARDRPLEEGND